MRVTIRRTLLLAFLALGLAPMVLACALAFLFLQDTMQDGIRRELGQQAGAITASLDRLLFERMQNASTWSQLDAMQDVQVGDVDRRIAVFLARQQHAYGGVYRALAVADNAGMVVAASDAAAWGKPLPAYRAWKQWHGEGVDVTLSYPLQQADGKTLALIVPLVSLADQKPIGKLLLELDWQRFESLLDREEEQGRMLAIVDDARTPFAASRGLRLQTDMTLQQALAPLAGFAAGTTASTVLPQWGMQALVAIGAAPAAPGSWRSGLHALVLQPEAVAFAPVRHLAWVFLALSIVLAAAIVTVAGRISGVLAQPILALTRFSRAYRLGQPAQISAAPASSEIAELRSAFIKMVDDVEAARRKLIHSAKLAAVGEMASAIVHEIRTPLGIMRSSAQVLKREPQLTPEARELIAFVESETERLNRLVSSLLDSARPKLPALARTDCHDLLHRAGAMLKPQFDAREVALHEHFAAQDGFAFCDAEQMTQVMLNLLQNALQAAPRGGTVSMATADAGAALQVCVDDDGPGIAAPDQTLVFEVFFSKREGGVGLGLAIVQQIVTGHGGEVAVGESPAGGARFTLTLPRAAPLPA